MREATAIALAIGLLAPAQALALPWNVDMVDSAAVKAYERPMLPLPAGVVSQPHVLTPISYRRNVEWTQMAEAEALTNPLSGTDPKVLATGQRMWEVYCWPCHGNDQTIGPVGERWPVVPRILPPSDPAAQWDDRLTRLSDGHIYSTIRNGSISTLMKPYGYAMTNDEMWSIVAWLRANPGLQPTAAPTPGGATTPTPAPAGATPTAPAQETR
jgi:hypothetical protein